MNAVATPTLKTTAKPAKKTNAAPRPSTSLSLLEAIQGDLRGARATITQIADSIGPTEAEIGLLLDMAASGAGRSIDYLQSAPLTGAACEEARGETTQTCALLRGAASLAKCMEVDIHSPSIISVCELVDESDNNLDRLSIDLSLSASIEPCATNGFSSVAMKDAFRTIGELLRQASLTDEEQYTGDSDRLLRMGADLADAAHEKLPAGHDIDVTAFNIAALVRASRLVPGDTESPARKDLIDQAETSLDWLAETKKTCTPDAARPALLAAHKRGVSQQVADSLPSGFNEHLVSNAWAHACEAREVVYACVMDHQGPEAIWGIHTIVNLACEKLNEMVNDSMTEEGCEDASNILAQAIAVACMLTVTVNGESWEMLLDAAISLMVLAKDRLDSGRGETCNA